MKKQMIILVMYFISIVLLSGQSTETGVVRGTILDKETELPIIGAEVVVLGSDPMIGSITDLDGRFRLTGVPLGRFNLRVTYLGYKPAVLRNQQVVKGKQTVLQIPLEEQVHSLKAVVVTARQNKAKVSNEMAAVSARTFTIEETEKYAGSLGDPSRMAANFAGVSSVADQRNDIVIRGNAPTGLLWRLDGIDIPNPNHFGASGSTGGPVSMLNNNVLANSEFYTSAFPAQYGNALSGVFDLKMRNGNNEKHEFLGQVGFNGFELGAEGPIGKGRASYLVNARYSTLEVLQKLHLDVSTGQAVPQYKDLVFRVNVPVGKYDRFSIFGMGGLSYIELFDSGKEHTSFGFGGVDITFGSDMGVTGANYTHYFDKNTRLNTHFAVLGSKVSTRLDSLDKEYKPNFLYYQSGIKETRYNLGLDLHKRLNTQHSFITGWNVKRIHINYRDSVLVSGKYIPQLDINKSVHLLQAYGQYKYKMTDAVSFTGGLYGQYLDFNKTYAVEPRLGMKWHLQEDQIISVGAGLHSQMQVLGFYFIKNNDGATTNEDLDFTKAAHAAVSYDWNINSDFRFKVESYYQHLYQVPVTDQRPEFSLLNIGDDFASFAYDNMVNEGEGQNYGLEFTLEKFLSKGYYFLSTVSLFESKYKGYDGIERNTKFNGNFVVNLLGGYEYKVSKHGVLGLDVKTVYAGGKRYVPIDVAKSKQQHREVLDWAHAYEDRLDDYFRLNARISFRLNSKRRNFSQEWALDLLNLTNHDNIYSRKWDAASNAIRTDYQQKFFPMFTYRIYF